MGTPDEPGPDQPSRGYEYPPLENPAPPPVSYAPVDFPTDPGQPPTAYPGPYEVQSGYVQSGYGQSGFPPPAYQQPGYPPPGYPPAAMPGAPYPQYPGAYPGGYPSYDPYGPPRPVGTNGKAIAALVTSLIGLGCCLFPGVVGIVLGVIAMREIKQTGQDGHGMALAGIIVGALALVFGLFALVLLVVFDGFGTSSSYSTY